MALLPHIILDNGLTYQNNKCKIKTGEDCNANRNSYQNGTRCLGDAGAMKDKTPIAVENACDVDDLLSVCVGVNGRGVRW